MNPFEQITAPIIQALQGLAAPAAIIGISIAILGYLLLPLLPTFQQQRGYIQMALLGVAVLGFVPALVTFFAGLGGGAGGASALPMPLAFAPSNGALIVPAFIVLSLV
jgi:hypothetical protein